MSCSGVHKCTQQSWHSSVKHVANSNLDIIIIRDQLCVICHKQNNPKIKATGIGGICRERASQVKYNQSRYDVAAILNLFVNTVAFDYLSYSHVTAHNEECGFSSDWIS